MRKRGKIIAVVAVAALVYPGVTYTQALTYPGDATFSVRTVDWLREMGAGSMINSIENWWYTRHPPSAAPPPAGSLPAPAAGAQAAAGPRPAGLPALTPSLPGEGVWVPGSKVGNGAADYTTFIRPDRTHPSVVVGVAWLNQSLVRTTLVAGTREPNGSAGAAGGRVPASWRSSLVATFNSGFKMKDCSCGAYVDGRQQPPLRSGAASAIVRTDGTVSIEPWSGALGPGVLAVRQNLDLVVDNGAPVPGLHENPAGHWGSASNQFQFTWRSGLGVDRAGNLIYVAGDKLTLSTLADAMAEAGVVRGMELDIHPEMVSFNSYHSGAAPVKLLPTMSSPATRYLNPDQRDFFVVALRPGQSSDSR
jgi:hypothetical protein